MNKKNVWFVTLFSLIIVLSIYYVTMPEDLLLTSTTLDTIEENTEEDVITEVNESSMLVALRVEDEENYLQELEEIKVILNDVSKTVDDKNNAYERLKNLNNNKSEQEKLEKQLKDEYNFDSFIKIDGNQIKAVVVSSNHSAKLANNIMRLIQKNYENDMHITVKFQDN